jgi:hypothetical protein
MRRGFRAQMVLTEQGLLDCTLSVTAETIRLQW